MINFQKPADKCTYINRTFDRCSPVHPGDECQSCQRNADNGVPRNAFALTCDGPGAEDCAYLITPAKRLEVLEHEQPVYRGEQA